MSPRRGHQVQGFSLEGGVLRRWLSNFAGTRRHSPSSSTTDISCRRPLPDPEASAAVPFRLVPGVRPLRRFLGYRDGRELVPVTKPASTAGCASTRRYVPEQIARREHSVPYSSAPRVRSFRSARTEFLTERWVPMMKSLLPRRRPGACSRTLQRGSGGAPGRPPGAGRRPSSTTRIPPDELHPAGRRRPPVPPAHGRGSPAPRSSAYRSSSSGRIANSGDDAPTYYLHTDSSLYYYSFTDAFIAMTYRALSPGQQARFDPMITGFNPPTCTASITSAAS